jgi:DNA recombination protein RmuC
MLRSRVGSSDGMDRVEKTLKEDFSMLRQETTGTARDNRIELGQQLRALQEEVGVMFRHFTNQQQEALKENTRLFTEKMDSLLIRTDELNRLSRDTQTSALKDFSLDQRTRMEELKQEQRELRQQTLQQLEQVFKGFQSNFDRNVESFNTLQREKFAQLT